MNVYPARRSLWYQRSGFGIVINMKILIRVLLLVFFALAIFLPEGSVPSWAYWSIFLLIFLMLFLYYRVEYYVREHTVLSHLNRPIRYSCFMAKVPPMKSEDLVRGRFIITEDSFELYQKGSPVRLVWSRPIEEIESLETAKVVGMRHGLIFNLTDGNRDLFVVLQHKKIYEQIIQVLGWKTT